MTMRNLRLVLNVLGHSGMLVFVLAVLWFGVFARPYLSYPNLPFPTVLPNSGTGSAPWALNPHARVRPGEAIFLGVNRCNSDSELRVYTIGQLLIPDDGVGPPYAMSPGGGIPIKPGCWPVISAANVIPRGLPPKRYHIEGASELNGVVKFVVRWSSESFDVVP